MSWKRHASFTRLTYLVVILRPLVVLGTDEKPTGSVTASDGLRRPMLASALLDLIAQAHVLYFLDAGAQSPFTTQIGDKNDG